MLEKLPSVVGRALRRVRPGMDALVVARRELAAAPLSIVLESAAFGAGEPIPRVYTADGSALSPPLGWRDLPGGTKSLILVVEDADSPTPVPLVHTLLWGIRPDQCALPEGALVAQSDRLGGATLGLNSYLKAGWLPPDPPPGHGPHRYGFQLFALDTAPDLGARTGRRAVIAALRGHVLARGLLVGTYSR